MPETGPLILTYSIPEIEQKKVALALSDNPARYNTLLPLSFNIPEQVRYLEGITLTSEEQIKLADFRMRLAKTLSKYEAAANLKFIEVAHKEDHNPHLKFEFLPVDSSSGFARIFDRDNLGEVAINLTTHAIQTRRDDIILHEVGHALMLAHPFDGRAAKHKPYVPDDRIDSIKDSTTFWPSDEAYRLSLLSIMSYYSPRPTELQTADIEALQFLYGAPGTDFSGVESILRTYVVFTHTTAIDIANGVHSSVASIIETDNILTLTSLEDAWRNFYERSEYVGAVVHSTDPHRATVTIGQPSGPDLDYTYVVSGDDRNDVRLVQNGNDVALVTVAGLDYENPADADMMNDYSIVETFTRGSTSFSRTYTFTVTDDNPVIDLYYTVEEGTENILTFSEIEILGVRSITGADADQVVVRQRADPLVQFVPSAPTYGPPTYDNPRDHNRDNIYEFTLHAEDTTYDVYVTVIDVV
jgi:hypothetical protein